jgi:hypothetical protein
MVSTQKGTVINLYRLIGKQQYKLAGIGNSLHPTYWDRPLNVSSSASQKSKPPSFTLYKAASCGATTQKSDMNLRALISMCITNVAQRVGGNPVLEKFVCV